jgi:rRNA-processing protein FCF1
MQSFVSTIEEFYNIGKEKHKSASEGIQLATNSKREHEYPKRGRRDGHMYLDGIHASARRHFRICICSHDASFS